MAEAPIFIAELQTAGLSAGEGDANAETLLVQTNTNLEAGAWAVVPDAGEPDTTFPLLPGTAAGSAAYVGAAAPFGGLATRVVTPLAGGESPLLDLQYWDGGAWVTSATMTTHAEAPCESYADALFGQALPVQVRVGRETGGAWAPRTLNGSPPLYWLRVTATAPLTLAPVLRGVQPHARRLVVKADGSVEFFGGFVFPLPWDLNTAKPASSSPANRDVFLSQTLDVGRTENQFNDGVTDRTALNFYLPPGIDTSKGMRVRFSWIAFSAAAGDVRWVVRGGPCAAAGAGVFRTSGAAPATAPGEVAVTLDVPAPGAADTLVTTTAYVLVPGANARPAAGDPDLMWLSLERDGGGDPYGGNVALVNLTASYVAVFDGGHASTY